MYFPKTRMRRLRKNSKIRNIVRETKLQKEDLIYPIYFKETLMGDEKEEISSLPGEFRYSLESGVKFAKNPGEAFKVAGSRAVFYSKVFIKCKKYKAQQDNRKQKKGSRNSDSSKNEKHGNSVDHLKQLKNGLRNYKSRLNLEYLEEISLVERKK